MKVFVSSLGFSMIITFLMAKASILSKANTLHINAIFLSGLVILLIGAILYVIRSGFLSLFFQGFVKIRETFIRQPHFMKEVNENIQNDISFSMWKENVIKYSMSFAFGIGLGMIIISTIWAL
ncbi:DUF3899 domain-containing protein [Lederbergia panacisoli]|uniref:DUF3899 domain-containing protein n=1 Tax=Lederbergia panacisoli TaxID=1255251 RepID=UPI00214BABD8|nr:DUF3899 domain-containing protein [Lederbergia panacisoli]MCR2821151.1 DUF3899 domain-containing protein [Lederbergia panacisoli]